MAALALTGAAAAILILRARWQEQYWRVLKTYAAPIMNTAELEAISVPLGNFEQSLLPTMTKHGCALVTGVIDESTLRSLETSFHFDLVSLVDEDAVNNGEPSMKQLYEKLKTGGVADFPKENIMSLTGTGLALKRCLSHSKMSWGVRMNLNVHRAFKALFPHVDGPLVSSLDVPFLSHDLPKGTPPPTTSVMNAHTDQNSHDARNYLRNCVYYQVILYIWTAEVEDVSTTAIWPGSHANGSHCKLMQDDNFKEWGSGGEHYCEIGGDMKDKHLARELAVGWAKQVRRVPAPRGKRRISLHAKPFTAHCAPHVVCFCAGSLFRWDTKTIHTGWLAGSRLAQAVALALASWRAESERAARLRLTALGFPSTHWARVGMQHDMVLDDGGIFGA